MSVFLQRMGLIYPPPSGGGGDPDWADVKLLLGYEGGTLTDDSDAAQTMSYSGFASNRTAQVKFGAQSGGNIGGSGYIKASADTSMNVGGGDWTMETWHYPTGGDAYRLIMGRWLSPSKSYAIWINANKLKLSVSTNGTSSLWIIDVTPTGGSFLARWYYFAADYDGSNFRLYCYDSVAEATTQGSNGTPRTLLSGSAHFTLGSDQNNGNRAWGYFDESRLTVGAARYTGTLVVPTEALPRS